MFTATDHLFMYFIGVTSTKIGRIIELTCLLLYCLIVIPVDVILTISIEKFALLFNNDSYGM